MSILPTPLGAARTPERAAQDQNEAKQVINARRKVQEEFFGNKLDRLAAIQAQNASQQDDTPAPTTAEGAAADIAAAAAAANTAPPPADSTANTAPPQEDDPVITRNGVTKKLSEWVAEIDTQYERAAQTVTRVNEKVQPAITKEELSNLTKALQTGSPEEAEKALTEVIGKAATTAKQETEKERQNNEVVAAIRSVMVENKDICNDKDLWLMAQAFDSTLNKKVFDANNPVRNAKLRVEEAFKMTREFMTRSNYDGKTAAQRELEARDAAKRSTIVPGGGTSRIPPPSAQSVATERQQRDSAIAAERTRRAKLRNE